MITAAPNNSKTIDTVVEVGRPHELNKSNIRISVIITDKKIIIISLKKKASGLNIPFLAISIIPLEDRAPIATPRLARIIIFLNEITLEPIAEFRKFTASLLTPTIRSLTARKMIMPIINK
tara:strand:+ start:1919 stop:2281 length:363 start_codon:yes stop_codon:yes gene_type:complete